MDESVTPSRLAIAALAALPGLLVVAVGGLVTLYAVIRLGIGRHGDVWWRPFENELTRPHVENLATFAVGLVGVAIGAWIAMSAIRRALSRSSS